MTDMVVEKVIKSPMPRSSVSFTQQGGVSNKLPSTATAYPHRRVLHQCSSESDWTDPKDATALKQHADDDAWVPSSRR